MLFHRLLVANRGEIAIRVFRAATELEIRTIGIYSHEDRLALHRFKCDEAYKVGEEGDPLGSYLNWPEIIKLAKKVKADAIHPGYGFLSENAEFAQACVDNGIVFCGPNPDVLKTFGDKLTAKKAAVAAGVSVIPGTLEPVESLDQAKKVASEIGYPVTVKAISGGGGKGIRVVDDEKNLSEAYERSKSEAMSSFGRADIYIEKTIENPKHIELQILGDTQGQIVHLYERDCSVQRRNQKIVEVAPAIGLSDATKEKLQDDALKIAKHVDYTGLGTVEFLVDAKGQHYFLEVNPRVQVEHTVTEMVTGYDLVQASIVVAAGRPMSHPAVGIKGQGDIKCRGFAIQCRITTEDPQNNFAPDTGRLIAYRPAAGFGIRLDDGPGTTGGKITPHYDSLLVKVTAFGRDFYGTSKKALRALREFRIRGVKSNIPLLINIIKDDAFCKGEITTTSLMNRPELFKFAAPRDRATKILRYLADVTVNNPHNLADKARRGEKDAPELRAPDSKPRELENAKYILDKDGPEGLSKWVKERQALLLTDTTMRDAHQSLFATRMRTRDMIKAAPYYSQNVAGLFSLEVWGGATFDTCLRFLKEDPWERLAQIRELCPNILLQMLLRGDNAVGYKNYPEWVIRDFVRLTVQTGLDVFRIFDCLNNPEQMAIAMDEVVKQGAIAEACVCYTGNIGSETETKYTVEYYINVAKRLEKQGAHILCIKDMAGLLRPEGARLLIKALKDNIEIPIHLHTHSTSGNAVAMLLAANDVGCDIVDGAVSSMSGLTSQPSMNALVASLEGHSREPDVKLANLDRLGRYWEGVRSMYQIFDPGIKATSTTVYQHEIPGGQYSNLYDQARRVGVSSTEFFELTERYREVNQLFGNIVKVTPSSKVVGDMALLLQKNNLTGESYLEKKPSLDYPDSVISFFKGHMGMPYGGFPQEMRELVLGQEAKTAPSKPQVTDTDTFDDVEKELTPLMTQKPRPQDVLSYRLYPKVFKEYLNHRKEFGSTDALPTPNFFFGLRYNEEISIDLEPGKTLIVTLKGMSDTDKKGERSVFYELNGYPRTVKVLDMAAEEAQSKRPKADPTNPKQLAANMPAKILEIKVAVGDKVTAGDTIMVTESMKMEYALTAKVDGNIASLNVGVGDAIEDGDLLAQLS